MAGKRKMYGEDKPIQRNKESRPGGPPNRSPGRSNAAKPLPSLREDVGKSVKDDVRRIKTGANPTAKSQLGVKSQKDAGSRAVKRMLGRAGAVGTAAVAGYDVGTAVNDRLKISDRAVEAAPPSKAERRVNLEYRKDSEMSNFNAGPKMYDDDNKRLRDINAHKWKGSM